jgi:hypothetical protein
MYVTASVLCRYFISGGGKGNYWPEAVKRRRSSLTMMFQERMEKGAIGRRPRKNLFFRNCFGGEELKFAEMRINGYIAAESFGNYWPAL